MIPTEISFLFLGVIPRLNKGPRNENHFVFVIRKGSDFKCETHAATQMRRFKFFTLELALPSREHYFSSLAGAIVDDVGFAEVHPELFNSAVEMDQGGFCLSCPMMMLVARMTMGCQWTQIEAIFMFLLGPRYIIYDAYGESHGIWLFSRFIHH